MAPFLDEWSRPFPAKPAWQKRERQHQALSVCDDPPCAFVVALAAAGIRFNRTRLLVIAAGVACLVLGESVPLIFTGAGHWGLGRWLAIAGAVLAVAGLAFRPAARSGDGVPQRPRGAGTQQHQKIEDLTGRKVIGFMSDNHIDPDIAVEVFILEPAGPERSGPGGDR